MSIGSRTMECPGYMSSSMTPTKVNSYVLSVLLRECTIAVAVCRLSIVEASLVDIVLAGAGSSKGFTSPKELNVSEHHVPDRRPHPSIITTLQGTHVLFSMPAAVPRRLTEETIIEDAAAVPLVTYDFREFKVGPQVTYWVRGTM